MDGGRGGEDRKKKKKRSGADCGLPPARPPLCLIECTRAQEESGQATGTAAQGKEEEGGGNIC